MENVLHKTSLGGLYWKRITLCPHQKKKKKTEIAPLSIRIAIVVFGDFWVHSFRFRCRGRQRKVRGAGGLGPGPDRCWWLRGGVSRNGRNDDHLAVAVRQFDGHAEHLQRGVEQQPDTVRGLLGGVRAGAVCAGRVARGQTVVVSGGQAIRAAQVWHTAVRGSMAGRTTGLRPVPRAPVLRTAGRDRAVPGHGERGPVAPVVRRRAVQERYALRVAGTRTG